jgi:hypothetical protein
VPDLAQQTRHVIFEGKAKMPRRSRPQKPAVTISAPLSQADAKGGDIIMTQDQAFQGAVFLQDVAGFGEVRATCWVPLCPETGTWAVECVDMTYWKDHLMFDQAEVDRIAAAVAEDDRNWRGWLTVYPTKYVKELERSLREVRRENLRLRARVEQLEGMLDDSIDAEVDLQFALEEAVGVGVL